MQQVIGMYEQHDRNPALEALDDGFFMLDREWRVTYWNAAAERALGLAREDALGHSLEDVLPHLRDSIGWSHLHRVQQEGTPRRFVESYPPGAGRGYMSIHAAPLPDGGVACHFREATDEVRQGEQVAAMLEAIRDGFVAVDQNWNIVYLNAVAESLLRFSRDLALGVSLWSLLPREPAELGEAVRATMSDGIQRHLREVRPEGRVFRGRVFDVWIYPLAEGGAALLFEDVSDRIQREKELARFAAEAQEANRAKSRFFAAISHELRTPLNAIVGYTHLLNTEAYGELPAPATRAAERAGICAEHLSRLVDDVLLLTTAEIGRIPVSPCPVLLQDFLPSMVEPLRIQALAKGLEFELHVPADLPRLETDPERLRQLLTALLSNAVKFTSRGVVWVEVSLCEGPPGPGGGADAYDLFSEPQVEIAVCDTGTGIRAPDRERIFGPFEQLGDPARSASMLNGTGLGLTIARQLSRLLRGSLYLAETTSPGSRFCLRVPLSYSAASA